MKTNHILAVYKKEILDLLRDKKTLITMVLVPLVLYPLIFMCSFLISSSVSNQLQSNEYQIILTAKEQVSYQRNELIQFLENSEDSMNYHLQVIDSVNPKEALLSEEADIWIQLSMVEQKMCFTISYLSSSTNSSTACDMVYEKLSAYSKQLSKQLLTGAGLYAEDFLNPISIQYDDYSSKEETLGNLLGSILPVLLIISILMGAAYPAIDATSGEKERGTLETLLTIPIRNHELIMGKFLAVSTITITSALLNILSMGMMAAFFYTLLEESSTPLSIEIASFLPAILIVILCIIAFAFFISAITMCVTSFAKSFKEANNYITPLLLVVMITGYVTMIPNMELTVLSAGIPIINICLLIKSILVFKYHLSLILIVLVTTCAYSALAILFLGKIYNSESILFDEGGVNLQLFTRRSNMKPGDAPTFADAMLTLAFAFLALIFAGTLLQQKLQLTGLFLTQLLILFIPVFAAWYTKRDFKKTFRLRAPRLVPFLGGILLEIGGYFLLLLLSACLTKLFPQDSSAITDTFDTMLQGVGFFPALFIIALVPAFCEEMFFRGYLLSAAKKQFRPIIAVLLTAAFFGIYHLSFVKFFTTGMLGILFAYAAMKTKSIFTSCCMHFINNGITVIFLYYGTKLAQLPFMEAFENPSLLQAVLFLFLGLTLGAMGLILLNYRKDGTIDEGANHISH